MFSRSSFTLHRYTFIVALALFFVLLALTIMTQGAASAPDRLHPDEEAEPPAVALQATATATPVPGCAPVGTIVPSPNQGTGGNQLNAVSASAANDVWAVGYATG